MKATMTLMGLYQFDNTIFDGLSLPVEFTQTDRETLIDNLILDTAELEILYPDAHFMMLAIRSWSRKELGVWEKLYATTVLKYNPIWNKDGTVSETESIDRTGTEKHEETRAATRERNSENSVDSDTSQSANSHNFVFGFNSDAASENGKTEDEQTGKATQTATGNENEKNSENASGGGNHEESETRTYTRTEQGNIGVTTTQSMIKEEREISMFNLYNEIISSFKKRFCLTVY